MYEMSGAAENLLSGIEDTLGRMFPKTMKTAQGRNTIRRAAKRVASTVQSKNAKLLADTMSDTQKFMVSQVGVLSEDTILSIKNGDTRLDDAVLFSHYGFPSAAGGGTSIEIWNSQNKLINGISNIAGNQLPKGMNFALNGIRLAYSLVPDTGGPDQNNNNYDLGDGVYVSTNVMSAASTPAVPLLSYIPTSILNGEFELVLQGDVIVSLPLSQFFINSPNANLTSTPGYVDLKKLESRKLLKELQTFVARVKLAQNTTLPTVANYVHALKIEMMGQATIPGRRAR